MRDHARTLVLGGLVAVTAGVGAIAWSTSSDTAEPAAGVPGATAPASAAPAPTAVVVETLPPTVPPPTLPPPVSAPASTTTTVVPAIAASTTDPTVANPPPGTAEAPAGDPLAGTQAGLQAAFAAAEQALAAEGIELIVNSGYRTPEHQQRLLDEAIVEYGSYEEAQRWVFEPDRSMHVQGLAVDIGSGPAADWLQSEGAQFGICQTLDWEWWHFEWRQVWQDRGACPAPVSEPEDAPGVNP